MSHENMAAMPLDGKSLNNILLWTQKADDLESWYAALGTHSNDDPGLTLIPILRQGQIWSPMLFCIGKR